MKNVYLCYPNGAYKCLTLSYDDGKLADRRLVEIMNRHGLKGTFHLNSGLKDQPGRIGSPDEIRRLYEGHEVACHTATHPTIARCPEPEVICQVLEDRRALEAILGKPVRGLSYPNGSHTPEIRALLKHTGICYSRIVGDSLGFSLPEDFMLWKPTCHHNMRLMEMTDAFLALEKPQNLYLMYVWGHSYEFDQQNNWQLMESFGRTAGGQKDIWYATNIEFYDYMEAWGRMRFAADNRFVYNPSAAEVWVRVDGGVPMPIPGGALVTL